MLKETADVGSTGQKITVMVGAEERSSLSAQTACSELRWKTECQLGTVVLGASLRELDVSPDLPVGLLSSGLYLLHSLHEPN